MGLLREDGGAEETKSVSSSQVGSARSEKSELTYKSLPDYVQFWTALILHLAICSLAIVIP